MLNCGDPSAIFPREFMINGRHVRRANIVRYQRRVWFAWWNSQFGQPSSLWCRSNAGDRGSFSWRLYKSNCIGTFWGSLVGRRWKEIVVCSVVLTVTSLVSVSEGLQVFPAAVSASFPASGPSSSQPHPHLYPSLPSCLTYAASSGLVAARSLPRSLAVPPLWQMSRGCIRCKMLVNQCSSSRPVTPVCWGVRRPARCDRHQLGWIFWLAESSVGPPILRRIPRGMLRTAPETLAHPARLSHPPPGASLPSQPAQLPRTDRGWTTRPRGRLSVVKRFL